MAQRRMLSSRIINSAKFLQMPLTAHALYFHLALQADDDGVVDSFPVMRITGAAQDDLKILLAKNFIKQLNEELVVFVTDWHEHNFIRADRKVDSVYKHLLQQAVPDVKIVQPKPRSDVVDNSRRVTQSSLPEVDCPRTVHGRHRLGKVRLNNNVNGTNEEGRKISEPKTSLHRLPNIKQEREQIKLIAEDIVAVLGDEHSLPFYTLVATKIPENIIRQKLAELKQGGAHSPAKAFTSAMKSHATTAVRKSQMSVLTSATQGLFKI